MNDSDQTSERWNAVLLALQKLYEQYHLGSIDTFWSAVQNLMKVYDEWLG